MKLLFLLNRVESDEGLRPTFDFFPFRFGPYSALADRVLTKLVEDGAVEKGSDGEVCADSRDLNFHGVQQSKNMRRLDEVVGDHLETPDDTLVDSVYVQWPEFTVLSERYGTPPDRSYAEPSVYTIGYEGHSIDSFLASLIRSGMARIVDVRRNAVSRKFGFSKKRLSALCHDIGVEYEHLPELGIASKDRQEMSSAADRAILLSTYARVALPQLEWAIGTISTLCVDKASALFCFESTAHQCHRLKLADIASATTGLPVVNL
jgi:uncharacterized protein (DUF488 family)